MGHRAPEMWYNTAAMVNEADNLTEQQLAFGYWFVMHKPQLKRIGFGILVAFDAIMIGFGVWGLVNHYLVSWNRDFVVRRDLGRSIVPHNTVVTLGPEQLITKSVQVFQSSGGRYDFLAVLQNPSQDWYAEFTYQFVSGSGTTPEARGFILPMEEKYMAQFAQEMMSLPRGAELYISDVAWQRVDRHVIRDFEAWRRERTNFLVTDVEHKTVEAIDRTVARTSFKIENRTAFGYWRLGTFVVLLRGSSPVAANFITLDQFDSGDVRELDVNWFESLPSSSTVDIRPEVNLFDPSAYLPPRAK